MKLAYSRTPTEFMCKNCKSTQTSTVRFEKGAGFWMCVLVLCIGLPPCCLIPFCTDSCEDAIHECPQCKQEVGRNVPVQAGGGGGHHHRSGFHHHHGIGHRHRGFGHRSRRSGGRRR